MTCPTVAKLERELREYHDSLVWRALAVDRLVDDLIREWRANPPPPRSAPVPISDAQFDCDRAADEAGVTVAKFLRQN